MFERFTERARQAVVLAQDEARSLKHDYIGTEHLLLGLLCEREGLAARVLESLNVTHDEVRAQVARIVGEGDEVATGMIPFTPRAKKVLELALREALSLGHNYLGTEHILLGIVRENEGVAARVLLDFDANAEKVRNEVVRALPGPRGRPGQRPELQYSPKSPPVAPEVAAELERLRIEKAEALEATEFERAARLRDRERRLISRARALEAAWEAGGQAAVEPAAGFQSVTERARHVIGLAHDEARTLKHNYLGTEHILLGLLAEEEGLAARVLESLNVTLEEVRAQVGRIVGEGDEVPAGQIPFTKRARKVLELALREALSLGHRHVGTEHILLGLVRENEGVAARILLDFDADAEKIRNEVIRMLSGPGPRAGRPGIRSELKRIQERLHSIERRLDAIERRLRREPE